MRRIVIAEDEKMIRQGIKVMVQRAGVEIEEIIECKNGLQALEVIKENKTDVVITDIRMPKMDGITLVKEITYLKHKPKVIVISGYDDFSYAVELLRNGAREYLLKPVEREKLAQVLKKFELEVQEEAAKNQQEKEKADYLLHHYLKHYLTEPTDEKLSKLKLEEAKWLEQNDYWIYCIPHIEEPPLEFLETIYLEDVNGQDLFIVGNLEERKKLEGYLEGYYYGISDTHQGLQELHTACEEAFLARHKEFFMGDSRKVHLQCMEHHKEHEEEEEMINHITQLIGTQRIKEVIKLLEVYECKVQRGEISTASFEKFMHQLLKRVQDTYKNVMSDKISVTSLKNMYAYKNIEMYTEAIYECFLQINEKLIEKFEEYKSKQKIQEALEYIQTHYHKDLNMAVVSNHISMNYSLFSLAFKKYTGINFVNYIKELRINEAKRLLVDTDKKINEISMLVGYENEKHFMKIFKGMYGVSPSEYRKNMQIGTAKQSHES